MLLYNHGSLNFMSSKKGVSNMEKMKDYMKRISVEGTRNRYVAILDILDEIGIEYRIQEETYSYEVPNYEKIKDDNIPGQMSFLDFVENTDTFSREEEILDEYNVLKEIASEMGMVFEEDERDDVYERFLKISEALELNGFNICEFEDLYKGVNEPKIVGYNKKCEAVSNIIISLQSYCSNPSANKIVLTAHYDVVYGSTGANDNASAVTILLLFIEEIMKRGKSVCNFEVVFLDREETGGKGCINYLSAYGDDIGEIINLDTCGVGESIVVSDYSRHFMEETDVLFEPCTQELFNVVETDYLPYCDSDIMKRYELNVVTICTLPPKDVEYFKQIKLDRDEKICHLLRDDYFSISRGVNLLKKELSNSGHSFKFEVYKYIHNGSLDSLECINYDIMTSILKYIELLIG